MAAATVMRRLVPRAMRMATILTSRGSTLNHRYYHHSQLASPFEMASFHDGIVRKESRGYASKTTKKGEDIKPPKVIPTLPGKYAELLFVEGAKAGILEQVESEMKEISKALCESAGFSYLVRDLAISKVEKAKTLRDAFCKANFSELTREFMVGVTKNGRLKHIKAICDCFEELMKAKRGHVTVVVTSVKELGPEEIENVKSLYISKVVKPEDTVFVEQKIDEDILGGVIIEIGDRRLDLSIARRIKEIEKILCESV